MKKETLSTLPCSVNKIEERLDNAEVRLDRIKNFLIQDHTNRIERLEDKIRQLETALRK